MPRADVFDREGSTLWAVVAHKVFHARPLYVDGASEQEGGDAPEADLDRAHVAAGGAVEYHPASRVRVRVNLNQQVGRRQGRGASTGVTNHFHNGNHGAPPSYLGPLRVPSPGPAGGSESGLLGCISSQYQCTLTGWAAARFPLLSGRAASNVG
jgi:hypothetical protein